MLHISRNKCYLLYRRCSFVLFALSARTSCNAHKKPPRIPSHDPKISTIIVSPSPAMDRACGAPSGVPEQYLGQKRRARVHVPQVRRLRRCSPFLPISRACSKPASFSPPELPRSSSSAMRLASAVNDEGSRRFSSLPCIHDPFPDEPLPLDSPHGRVSL